MMLVTLTRADNKKIAVEADDILRLVEANTPDRTDMVMKTGKSITIAGNVISLTTWINPHRSKNKGEE